MNVEELLSISEGLSWVTEKLTDLKTDKAATVSARTICTLANLIVSDLAHSIANGIDLEEALRRAAEGSVKMDNSTMSLLKLMAVSPKS